MRRVLWQALGISVAVLVAAVLAVIINQPTLGINNRIAKLVKDTTGRDVEYRGRTVLRFRPALALRIENAALMAPPEMAREPFVQVDAIEVEPAVLTSLWRWSWTISSIRVEGPKIMLVHDRAGRANWDGLGGTAKGGGKGGMPAIGVVDITGGLISYTDQRTGFTERSDQFVARLTQLSPETPVDAIFATILKKQRFDGVARLPAFNAWGGDATLPARLMVVSDMGRAEFDGTMGGGTALKASARSSIAVPSLERVARWLELEPARLGSGAFTFSGQLAVEPAPPPPATTANAGQASAPNSPLEALRVPSGAMLLSVRGGDLSLTDTSDKQRVKAEKIDATVTFASLAEPAEAAADMTVNDERIEAHVLVASPRALLAPEAGDAPRAKSAASARIFSARGRLELTGEVHPGKDPAFHCRAKGETSNLRGLAKIANVSLPVDQGLESAEIDGEVSASRAGIRLWNAAIKVDETTARGELSVDLQGQRTTLGGKLALDRLDAGRYDPRLVEPARGTEPSTGATGGRDAEPEREEERKEVGRDPFASTESISLVDTLRGCLDGDSTRPGGLEATAATAKRREGWSEQAIPQLKSLKDADLDLDFDLSIGELNVAGRRAAVTRLKSTMRQGRLAIEGADISSHGGKIQLDASIDTAAALPTMTAKIKADGVDAEQLFADLGIRPVLAGKARIDANLSATGRSEKALLSTLKGRVETISERSAAVVGWDLRTSWRTIIDRFRSKLGMLPPSATARTPIDRLEAVIDVSEGVAETKEARINSQYFRATADARANLVENELESTGTFKTFVIPELELPFKVTGSLNQPKGGLDKDRVGFLQAISTIYKVVFSGGSSTSGASLESTAPGGDRELDGLLRRYVDKVEGGGSLSPADAAAARELRRMLGPAG